MLTADEPGQSHDATERLLLQRVARAEHLVAAQRLRVHRLQAGGFDTAQSRALLGLMEAIAEQFRTAWRLYRRHQARPLMQPGVWPSPATPTSARSVTDRVPAEVSRAPAAKSATFPCSHCGLTLALSPEDEHTLVYEVGLWRQRCRHQALQTPVLCQLLPGSADTIH